LLDLLEQFAVFNLGQSLAARDTIAEADRHGFEAAVHLRRRLDRGQTDQVADDHDFLRHVGARDGRQFDRHRRPHTAPPAQPAAARAAPAPAGPPPRPPGRTSPWAASDAGLRNM
jgi:hypothetical protein